jgi:hypothetical protein
MDHCGALWLKTVRERPLMPPAFARALMVARTRRALSGTPLTRPTCAGGPAGGPQRA